MSEFFKRTHLWVVDFHYEGRPRRWLRSFAARDDVHEQMASTLKDLYGRHARLVQVRKATDEEERQYLRGEVPGKALCPTGRSGASEDDDKR